MADLVALVSYSGSDGPERFSFAAQYNHFPDRLLLGLMRNEIAAIAATEPERDLAAEIPAPGLLIGFHLANALADAIPLGLGEGGRDRQEQFRPF